MHGLVFPSVSAGTYHVGWELDLGSGVCESNEANNTGFVLGKVLMVQ